MCGKLLCLISFVLVLGLVPVHTAKGVDPGLVGWWKFDEMEGTIAYDSSGNGNDGAFVGNPQWVPGQINGALNFDGTDDNVYAASVQLSTSAFTLTCWFNSPSALGASNTRQDFLYWQVGNGRPHVTFNRSGTGEIGLWPNVGGDFEGPLTTTRSWAAGTWYHIAGTFDGTSFEIYVNGNLENVVDHAGTHSAASGLLIGCRTNQRNHFEGKIDDVRHYNRALMEAEIKELFVWRGVSGQASGPEPDDEETDVPRDVVLGWTPGIFAPPVNGHKVYLSENFNDVNDGIGGIAQDANSYAPPQRLDFGTTYYWRVDEVNGPPDYTVYEGSVWSFTTEPIGYAIENIIATASSAHAPDMGPENTVNSSGLDDNDLHSKEPPDMWLSSGEPLGAWIGYEFDKDYKLHEMWVWNSNQTVESLVGFGLKDVTIEYSLNGTDYTTLGTTHEFAQAPGTPGYAHNTTVDFGGAVARYVRLTANSNWGALPQYGLSEIRFFYIPVWAREPYPDSGATDVDVDVVLGWRTGREAAEHNVYFSSDEQAVADGTAPVTIATEASHGPLSLDLGQSYYWRVDEVNEVETHTTWDGDVWNFRTPEFLVVDDFESYNDFETDDPESSRIFLTWIDGYEQPTNGSIVGYENPPFAEQTIVQGGKQSMPFFYSNTDGAAYSQADRTFVAGQNWADAGIAALMLHFYGTSENTGQLYVRVNDSKVVYGGDAADIAKARWQQWNIELVSFGVNLQNVTKLSIGIDGNGASGVLYFDDIRLYPSRCVASERKPQGDINNDCVVDYKDVEIMASDWLMSDYTIAVSPTAPGNANLVAHYTLDNNVLDSSGNNLNGTENGNLSYVAGVMGQAISLDGDGDYVDCTNNVAFDSISDAVTVAAWIKVYAFDKNYQAIVAKGDSSWRLSRNSDTNNIHWRCNGPSPDLRVNGNVNVNDGHWHHVAGTYDGSVARLYVDGVEDGSVATSGPISRNVYGVHIGANAQRTGREWNGLIDDVRIYSRALSEAEVGYLADTTPGDGELYVPVKSPAELYNAEPANSRSVDFKDFAEIAGQWLDEQLWPE